MIGGVIITSMIAVAIGYTISYLKKEHDKPTLFPRNNITLASESQPKSQSDSELIQETPDTQQQPTIIPQLTHKIASSNEPGMGIRIITVSDTHGHHRKIDMPPAGDIFIHAGDFTLYGKRNQAEDFNEWLGELPYRHKFVVNGNHEQNAPWKVVAKNVLSNAKLLIDESVDISLPLNQHGDVGEDGATDGHYHSKILRIHGMDFNWPVLYGTDPRFDKIDDQVDILISHCPAEGYVDRKKGCPSLLKVVERIKPKILICGHEHNGRGVEVSKDGQTTFVNSATAKGGTRAGHTFGKQPVVILL
jgi:predicted phosphodiesterase